MTFELKYRRYDLISKGSPWWLMETTLYGNTGEAERPFRKLLQTSLGNDRSDLDQGGRSRGGSGSQYILETEQTGFAECWVSERKRRIKTKAGF